MVIRTEPIRGARKSNITCGRTPCCYATSTNKRGGIAELFHVWWCPHKSNRCTGKHAMLLSALPVVAAVYKLRAFGLRTCVPHRDLTQTSSFMPHDQASNNGDWLDCDGAL